MHQLDHRAAERIADEQVALAVAKPVMTMPRVGRILGFSQELPGCDEARSRGNFTTRASVFLRLTQDHVFDVARFADDKRKRRVMQLRANIADEMHKIFLVLGRGLVFAPIVPTLKPNEAFYARSSIGQLRKRLWNRGERRTKFTQHLRVVATSFATRARWTKVLGQTLATPRGLDEKHRLVEPRTECATDAKLRTKVMRVVIHRVAHRERACFLRALFSEIRDEHVIAFRP